uniref:Ovule protein n=1 Tax=Strongyloides venezuelensis TaxID=75913 RepID=A0A0K0FFV7_STRVS
MPLIPFINASPDSFNILVVGAHTHFSLPGYISFTYLALSGNLYATFFSLLQKKCIVLESHCLIGMLKIG